MAERSRSVRTWALVLGGLALVVVLVALAPSVRSLAASRSEQPVLSVSQAPATFVVPVPKPRPVEVALVAAAAMVLLVGMLVISSSRAPVRLLRREARYVLLRAPPCCYLGTASAAPRPSVGADGSA